MIGKIFTKICFNVMIIETDTIAKEILLIVFSQISICRQMGQCSPVQSWSASSAIKSTEKSIPKVNAMKIMNEIILLCFGIIFPLNRQLITILASTINYGFLGTDSEFRIVFRIFNQTFRILLIHVK